MNRSQNLLFTIIGDHFDHDQKVAIFSLAIDSENPVMMMINKNVNFFIAIFDTQMSFFSCSGNEEIDPDFFDLAISELLIDEFNSIEIIDIVKDSDPGWKNHRRSEINEAYLFLREKNQTIDSGTLEWMRDTQLFMMERSYLVDEKEPELIKQDVLDTIRRKAIHSPIHSEQQEKMFESISIITNFY